VDQDPEAVAAAVRVGAEEPERAEVCGRQANRAPRLADLAAEAELEEALDAAAAAAEVELELERAALVARVEEQAAVQVWALARAGLVELALVGAAEVVEKLGNG